MKALLLRWVKRVLRDRSIVSYAQLGEDRILDHLFRHQDLGTYVDVGSNDPVVYSNTYKLYERGWSGVCIDANPSFASTHQKLRPRDRFIHSAVSQEKGQLRFKLNEDHRTSHVMEGDGGEGMLVPADTLSALLEKGGITGNFDLLNIDIEGHEMPALQSLDFQRFTPGVVLVEIHQLDFGKLAENEIYAFMRSKAYTMVACSLITAVFVREELASL